MNCGKHQLFDAASAWISVVLLGFCPLAFAQCNSNPIAVDDAAEYRGGPVLIVDVLANDVEPDGEALAVDNLTTTCPGSLSEDFGLVTLTVAGLSDDCTINYRIVDEGVNDDDAVVDVAVVDVTQIFSDGFESGDTSGWTSSQGRDEK